MTSSHIFRSIWRLGTVAVAGDSMAPTYNNGDWLVVRWGGTFAVGQILVIEREDRPGFYLIKRLKVIENGRYWVEGDNKLSSTDSRQWGTISHNEILGRVLFRYRNARNNSD
ncbi:unannotated protein [freshwater metagenome]|uniref:Unannotated protein n=1 Tax=freshwater metagenome TaxID=449393 RepID=A0A6J6M7Y6_9ZZZZ